jgi:DNA-binding Lrp family transcriptional regulator
MPEFELNDISELRHERDRFEALLTEAIRRARAKGDSWEKIAQRLGVSRPAAWERYRHQVEE